MSVAAGSGLVAAAIGLVWVIRARMLRLRVSRPPRGLPRLTVVSRAGAAPAGGTAGLTADGAARDTSPDDAVER